MKKEIVLYSPQKYEIWNYDSPYLTGIGGSETCHIELAFQFANNFYPTISYNNCKEESLDFDFPLYWKKLENLEIKENQIWLVFRDPDFFSKDLPKSNKYYFIAQDVGYTFTEEQLSKIDKYICLCKEHVNYTLQAYPSLKGRVFLSSNGINVKDIEEVEKLELQRNPNKLIYFSSPDRGLFLILRDWFRIREFNPNAELEVCYGFNTMDKFIEMGASLSETKSSITSLLKQEGVTFTGRVNQIDLKKKLLESSIWFYPTSWEETSCISCMEAQACGLIPVTNNYWALKQNILDKTYVIDGVPQESEIVRFNLLNLLNNAFQNQDKFNREKLMKDARDTFSWEKIAKQYMKWFEGEK